MLSNQQKNMKTKVIFGVFYLFINLTLHAQKEVQSKITGVTVFMGGAQIVREASVQVQTGTNVLIFSDLPQYINPATILVESESAITLHSVKHSLNYLKNQDKPKEVVRMEDSVKILTQTLQFKNSMLQVVREEESMLLANKSIGGQNNGVQADNLKSSSDFFRNRLTDIKTRQYELTIEIQKINETIQRLNNQISQMMSLRGGPVSEITVTVSAKNPITSKIRLSYFLPNAGWTTLYDIRATEVGKPIQLSLKANVYNNTGEPWENARLTLSTANPLQTGVKPVLKPWYLYAYKPVYDYRYSRAELSAQKASVAPTMEVYDKDLKNFETTASYTTVQQTLTTIEYVISIPYTIPSDGKEYTVDIQEYSLDATYEYQCIPKIDRDAFLVARITGWAQYHLLPGQANLFAEGKFIGTSYIDPASVKDTLDISLGRDKGITITREMLKDFSGEKLIGTNKTINRTYEISVRNKKNTPILIIIEDQIPLSNQKDIVVEFDAKKADNAEYDSTTGFLKWKLNLKSGETVKLKYSFTVKHPKEMILQVW